MNFAVTQKWLSRIGPSSHSGFFMVGHCQFSDHLAPTTGYRSCKAKFDSIQILKCDFITHFLAIHELKLKEKLYISP